MNRLDGSNSTLALFGGQPIVTGDLRAAGAWAVVTDWAKAKVNELLDAGGMGLSKSPMIQELEAAFADYSGAKYCLSMVNGTAGIRTALWVCQVGPGDEVICPSFTWWPTTVPAASMGAKVVFAEIEPDTLGLDPTDVEKRITSRTKAVVVAHILGMPANLDGLVAVCKKHSLPLIEDACLAPGARYRGRCVGTFGEFGIFSLQAGKGLPAGEGGLLICNDLDLYEKALAYGHAKRIKNLSRKWQSYDVTPLGGVKNRLHSVSAVIGLGSLKELDSNIAKARYSALRVQERILRLPGLSTFRQEPHIQKIYHYNVVFYDAAVTGVSCERVLEALAAEGLPVSRTARLSQSCLQHQQRFFVERGSDPNDLPVTRKCADRTLMLPRLHNADDDLLDQCARAFEKVWDNLDQLRDS